MIRNFANTEANFIKISIDLKNGESLLGKDIPPKPFDVSGFVSYWEDDALIAVPLDTVKKFTLYSDKS